MPDFERCVRLTRHFFRPEERPDRELVKQLTAAHSTLTRLVQTPLNADQTDALVCLIGDIEAGLVTAPNDSLDRCFLVTVLNRRMMHVAVAQFQQFCSNHGRVNIRALHKRLAEQQLFLTGLLPSNQLQRK